MIGPGTVVVATRDGTRDHYGLPLDVPLAGQRYIVVETYEMPYGQGCTLEGLDHFPYRGYFLHRRGKSKTAGWYFKEVNMADEILAAAERSLKDG